ncbi:helix-turn-helix domain-containing GNAT family N-acetyltransferase [Chitinophaga sp. GbtcB8]|uniref:bifunctional helix-turn-helix transcriptional regulator/GNAT family N-acetyltransferase n=1 Tax=Chitinophaga sp. GbtcB8 TaxID=2824753 RepID=UPI001C30CD42|nr:helix-turn-helix domain-containing GNAT family N-acetyltransferase [Chitinophaga sp. GbtcB8]
MSAIMEKVKTIRQFNRFYTRQIGLLDQHILDSNFSLSEVRVLYEIGNTDNCTAGHLTESLVIDGGYLSRILKVFERDKIMSRRQSATDGRTWYLQLTAKGKKLLQTLEARSNQQIADVLQPLAAGQQQAVIESMETIQQVLSEPQPLRLSDLVFRHELLPGDVGYLIYLHGEIYAKETGYNLEFEGYVCKTFYDFLQNYHPSKDRVFLATYKNRIVGAAAILGHSKELGQLRWLLVHPDMRGIGLGKKLVDDAMAFCREQQYKKVYLLTTDQQTTAAKLYTQHGFIKTEEVPQEMWGHRLSEVRYELIMKNE